MATSATSYDDTLALGQGAILFQTSGPKRDVDESERVKHHIYSHPPEPSLPRSIAEKFTYHGERFHGVSIFVNTWINKFPKDFQMKHMPSEDLQPHMRTVAESIRFIPFKDFLLELGKAYTNMKTQLDPFFEGDFRPERDAIILVEGRKSNKWVAELALKHYKVQASQYVRLGIKQANQFVAYVEEMRDEELQAFRERIEGKVLMLFDDGSYSGRQMREHVEILIRLCSKKKLHPSFISIVIPYRTTYAEACLVDCIRQIPKSCKLRVLTSSFKRIPVLSDLAKRTQELVFEIFYESDDSEGDFSAKTLASTKKMSAKDAVALYKASASARKKTADLSILEKLGMIWFEFKVPNSQSLPAFLVKGSICDRRGRILPENFPVIPSFSTCYSNIEKPIQEDLGNFHKVDKHLYRGAQPTEQGVRELHEKYRIQTIINLRDRDQILHASEIERLGMTVVPIPINWKAPDRKDILEFLTYTLHNMKLKRPVFVHCYRGAERTGAVIAILRLCFKCGMSEEFDSEAFEAYKVDVLKEMKEKGFHEEDHLKLYEMVSELTLKDAYCLFEEALKREKAMRKN